MKDLKDMKRVLLKLSGEALAGDKKTGFDEATCADAARQVKTLVDQGIEVGIVIGGGNFCRGRSSENIDQCLYLLCHLHNRRLIKAGLLFPGQRLATQL